MKKKIAVIEGDGIGPEVTKQAIRVLDAIAASFNHEFEYSYNLTGADAIDKTGNPLPDETIETCLNSDAPCYGALDLGTNNCRLLIATPSGKSFRVVEAYSRIVRLGEGLSASGRLSEAAMERAMAALKISAEKVRRRRVVKLKAIATQACRMAGVFSGVLSPSAGVSPSRASPCAIAALLRSSCRTSASTSPSRCRAATCPNWSSPRNV